MANYNTAVTKVLKLEGSFQQMANDKGNYCGGKLVGTKYGIAGAYGYYEYYKKCPTLEQMKALTKDQAIAIYKKLYWDRVRGNDIDNQQLAELIFDSAVNQGVSYALKNVKKDLNELGYNFNINSGIFTDTEVSAINKSGKNLFTKFLDTRKESYSGSSQSSFVKGWLNRLEEFSWIEEFKRNRGLQIGLILAFVISIGAIVWLKRKSLF